MDGIFGMIDGKFKLSIVDSTMMLIVHRAMDKAHQRVKSREGVIERLHEISKFYELSVMQLDGCIKFVQEETDTHNPETSHEEVLAGLAEIRNRLQRRLYESELAILQKDRELADRSESEVKLRQALEITERELVSSQEDLELERSRSAGSSNLSPHEGEDDENRDGEFGEVKEKQEFGDDYEPKVKTKRNRCINDVIRVEEMGSDIDILKETLDIAFGKMHSAILISEMGAIEQQVKSSIENDIISILLKGFVKDCQEDLEAEVTRKEKQVSANKRWSDLMNEVIGLFEDLKPVIGQNEMQSRECNILDFESIIKKKSIEAEQDQLNSEMLHDKTSLSLRREESPESLKRRFQEILERLENSMILNATVNKSIEQNEDFSEEDIPLEKGEQIFVENHKQKSDVDTLADVWGKMHQLQDEENSGIQNQICALRQEREDREFQNIMKEETYITLLQGLREKFCDDLSSWELEILISDGIYRDLIRSMFNQLDETMKSNHTEAKIKDDIYHVVFKETMEDYCSINDSGLDRLQECKIKKSSILELHNMELNKSDSKSLKLMELPHITYDFELMANRKLEAIMLRLEEMKHTLDPLPQAMASLQENKSLYKKAFIRRCQNLRKAENEVDILGDQVDILLSLIEKIYSILNQQSPALQQYFDVISLNVSEILRSIEEEVPVIVCTPPEKLDTI
ncbi:WPP domain-associated protein isoform X2 [Cucumis melo var. makuwa]|uniref:WPP domain-associated protein isoform X2 n=1 Tax=Cucumis melo var. makuwa TaxID=1194695 RepID=A0A5D3CG51_CUCMM|nr:WPP domain-associated protein isoform X2 [Cucumis melo var. makuwa]TYK09279.1 WPP domain-associated protein isoform X2 [Cucumis melo var. makuwa]